MCNEITAANLPPSFTKLIARGGQSRHYLTSAALAIILRRGRSVGAACGAYEEPLRRGDSGLLRVLVMAEGRTIT